MTDHGDEGNNQAIPTSATAPGRPRSNRDWWPNQPDLRVLHQPAPQASFLDDGCQSVVSARPSDQW
jgi:catalase-peroxidase